MLARFWLRQRLLRLRSGSAALWFGKLWFGKLTNQTHQPHECGGMVKPIKVALCGGKAPQKKMIPLC